MWSGRPALPFRCNLDKHLHAAASLNSEVLNRTSNYIYFTLHFESCVTALPVYVRLLFSRAMRSVILPVLVMEFCEKLRFGATRPLPPINPLTKQDLITVWSLLCSH